MNELKEIKRLIKKIYKAKEKIEFHYLHIDSIEKHLLVEDEFKKKAINNATDEINEEKALIEVTKRKIERIIKDLLDKI